MSELILKLIFITLNIIRNVFEYILILLLATVIQRWNCNTFDVNNSSSANWSVCYTVGQCAATSNSAGTRTTCYI